VNPQTGVETVLQGPENTWQNIGTLPGGEAMGGMDIFALCNINMMYMAVAVFVCLFISGDFRSGYAKNLFTVRAKKGDYVLSKTVAGMVCGALMLICYFIGTVLGGAMAGLSFDLHGGNMVLCMLSKICLMPVFVSIFVLISVAAKQKAWLALCGSLGGGMLLFMMVGMITPINATVIHVVLCLAGSLMFTAGLGSAARVVLCKTSLV
jgi:ABC-type transport system involved in multi-copper enzyme maturation permease subunit